MRNIKIVLEYDGSPFFGFQKQPNHPTVQAALERALSELLNQKSKIQAASGRTDTGVHALCQVVNFKTESRLGIQQIQKGLNALLPQSVVVNSIEEVRPEFHARYSARAKTYEYRVWNHSVRSPLLEGKVWHVPYSLDLVKMRKGASLLCGRRNFQSFCAAHGAAKGMIRTVRRFQVSRRGRLLIFRIKADGFLYHMVRNIVGTLVEVGRNKLSLLELKRITSARDRKAAGPTAPACGLFLVAVTYCKKRG